MRWKLPRMLSGFNEAGARAPRRSDAEVKIRTIALEASMRPGRARPGDPAGATAPLPRPRASMRAGRARPGDRDCRGANLSGHPGFNEAGARAPRRSRGQTRRPGIGRSASMRPGRARPGDPMRWCMSRKRSAGFNEAGARAPRRFLLRSHSCRPTGCFNEAGARAPRRSPERLANRVREVCASMRPGRARPGDSAGSKSRREPLVRFNEAGARAPRRSRDMFNGYTLNARASMRPGRAPPRRLREYSDDETAGRRLQ